MNRKSGIQNNQNRLYRIWVNMKSRCYNPNVPRFNRYGGRGITVCEEWLDDFMNFYKWAMENGYSDELSIDRIDSDGNYEPVNCKWSTHREQNINKSSVPLYRLDDITFTQSDVYKLFGVKRTTFQARLKRGLSIQEAVGVSYGV